MAIKEGVYWDISVGCNLIIAITYRMYKNHKGDIPRWIVLVLALCLIPLGLFCEEIYAPAVSVFDSTGALILPAMNYVFALSAVAIHEIEGKVENCIKHIGNTLIGIIVFIMLLQVSVFQNCMENNLEIANTIADSILREISSIEDADNCCLVICGKPDYGLVNEYDIVRGTVAKYGVAWDDKNSSGWWHYFKHYEYNNSDARHVEKDIMPTQEYELMPSYPQQGYVRKIDDAIIVKLGE